MPLHLRQTVTGSLVLFLVVMPKKKCGYVHLFSLFKKDGMSLQ
jgi:hypothetical protein